MTSWKLPLPLRSVHSFHDDCDVLISMPASLACEVIASSAVM